MSASPVRRRYRWQIAIALGGGIASLLLAFAGMYWLLIPILTASSVAGLGTFLLRCPKCHKAALNNPMTLLGVEIYTFTPWMPEECTRCGEPL